MEIGFPCPSTSINLRYTRKNTEAATNTLNRQFVRRTQMRCSLFVTVAMFLFPDGLIKETWVSEFFVSSNFPEIEPIVPENVNNKDAIVNAAVERRGGKKPNRMPTSMTLLDVFDVVNRNNFPFLWNAVVRTMSMMPTTVSCEQYFCRLRHETHENTSKETAFGSCRSHKKRNILF